DLALFHHRISGPRDTGVGEKILNVAETAGRLIEQIFRIAVAIHPSRYPNIMPINAQLGFAITESERDLGKAHRLAGVGAVENDVRHLVTAKRLGRLLPKHPAYCIEHI